MFSSETVSGDMNRSSSFLLSNPGNLSSFKQFPAEGELFKSKDFASSDLFMNQSQIQQEEQQSHQSIELARYRSAPSSFLAAVLDSATDNSSSGGESEALFSAFMDGPPRDPNQKSGNDGNQMKQEAGMIRPGQNGSVNGQSAVNGGGGVVVGSHSVGMENQVNLVRQSSSPAGFFNGYGAMSSHMNLSSSSRFVPGMPENVNQRVHIQDHENRRLGNGNSANGGAFDAVFRQDSWINDSPFSSLERNQSNFNGSENQNGETRRNAIGLVHHLSLPKTSSEMAEIEKLLQFQPDAVPCQMRAKRGCATHPRSIAERNRRIRISERMKKLHDLFPNMDKQTSTADMLDLTVEYIKDLQKQVQTLTEARARCVCSSKPEQTSPTT